MLIFSIIYTFTGTEKLRSSIGGGVRHRTRELLKTWRLHHVAGRFFASVGSLGRRGLSAAELAGQVAAESPTAETSNSVNHDLLEARLRVPTLLKPLEPRPSALQLSPARPREANGLMRRVATTLTAHSHGGALLPC